MEPRKKTSRLAITAALVYLGFACVTQSSSTVMQHRWWAGLGPVLPHDTFPTDCTLCHIEGDWQTLREDFHFDHEKETGVPLVGAHAEARCLRCHNDRGPVAVFTARGCSGCHEDIHAGDLGNDCTTCHRETTWQPFGQIELHARTRFPLDGAHAFTSCRRCHVGAPVGNFLPIDTNCVTCHRDDLARTTNHVGLGWVDRCNRCHMPTLWEQAVLD
jgi:hypothetical protein